MPHESTVNPYDYMGDDMSNMVNRISRGSVTEQLIKPETPSELTHYEEFDDDDEESDESKSVENAASA